MLKIYFRNIMSSFSITQTTKGNKRTGLQTNPKETSPVFFAIQPRFGTCLSIHLVKTTFSEFVNEHVDGKDGRTESKDLRRQLVGEPEVAHTSLTSWC